MCCEAKVAAAATAAAAANTAAAALLLLLLTPHGSEFAFNTLMASGYNKLCCPATIKVTICIL